MTQPLEERAVRFAKEHPGAFRALERLRAFDIAEIERRVLAAAGAGQDPHKEAACAIFGVPTDQVTPDMRKAGKAINYGILYTYNLAGDDRLDTIRRLTAGGLTVTGRKSGKPDIQNVKSRRTQ